MPVIVWFIIGRGGEAKGGVSLFMNIPYSFELKTMLNDIWANLLYPDRKTGILYHYSWK